MEKAWGAVAAYAAANALNPCKGYKLGELTTDEILAYAGVELFELARAPEDVSEMADLLGCLFHYAQRKGWSMELIERELIRKLALRFPGAVVEKAGDTQGYTHGYAPEEVIYGDVRRSRAGVEVPVPPSPVESLAEYDRRMVGKLPCSICCDPNCDNPGGKH